MKALEQEKEEKMTLSEEEREKADAEIKELVIKRTELFNYKQTLDTSKEKAKIKETSAEISRLDGEIKALQKAKEEKIKANLEMVKKRLEDYGISGYFKLLGDKELEVQPGIYEITFSGLIEDADTTHGATLYLQTDEGSAIKDLTFNLPIDSGKQMHFSQAIIFRFEKVTILKASSSILGDTGTSSVTISDVNLLIKKVHE